MSGTVCASIACDRPSPHGYVCPGCLSTVRDDLEDVPWLVYELTLVLARLNRYALGDGVCSRSADTPMPFHKGASDALERLKTALYAGIHAMAEQSGVCVPETGSVASTAAQLTRNLDVLSAHPAAGRIVDDLIRAMDGARWTVDRPADARYIGPCDDCERELYARVGRSAVQCPHCGRVYDVAARQDQLMTRLEDQLATCEEITRAFRLIDGRELTQVRIRQWAARGKLDRKPPHPADAKHRPRYRVGDVRKLIHDHG